MYIRIVVVCMSSLAFFAGAFVGSASAATAPQKTVAPAPNTTAQQRSVEEVNSLIIDSYRSRLDRVLDELYANIEIAAQGDDKISIRALTRVRDDLDDRLDALAEAKISSNRRKILTGVYFYLKSNIEEKMREMVGEK